MLRTTRAQSILWIGVVVAVLLTVAIVMRTTAAQNVAPYVPLWADQVQYLTEAYRGYDLIREHGLVIGTIEAVRQPRPQGWLLQTLASMHMQVVGAGRLGALDMNLALLLLWLGVTSYAIKRVFGISASFVALGLMLSTAILLNNPAGPFDFRLDYAAMCLWGTLIVLIAISGARPGPGTAGAILVVGAALISTRFITVFYLLPFGALVTLLAVGTNWKMTCGWRRLWSPLILVVAVWGVLAVAILALNYSLFQSYYVRGHVTGEEVTIRRVAAGILSAWDDIVFYPWTVSSYHLTRSFHYPAAVTLIVSLVSGLLVRASSIWPGPRKPRSDQHLDAVPAGGLGWFLGVATLGLIACYFTLTVAQQKHAVVAGPFIPPVVLLVVGVGLLLSRASWDNHPVLLARLAFWTLGPVMIVAALVGQWERLQTGPPGLYPLPVLQTFTEIVDDAVPYLEEAREGHLVWSIDGHYVEISSTTIRVFTYERSGRWINLQGGLGHGPMEQTFDATSLLQAAGASDLLVLVKHPPGTRMGLPSDQMVLEQHDILERYAEEHLTLINRYEIQGTPYLLYVRPRAPDSTRPG